MTPRILTKFCGLIAHSIPKNMILSAFPGKIPEIVKIFLIFFQSPNIGPKSVDQSRLNSIHRVLSQILLAQVFVFNLPLKLRVVHIKKFKKLYFLKNGSNEIDQIL